MSFVFEIVLQFILDIAFTAFGEAAAEAGLNSLEKSLKHRTIGKVLRGVTYVVVGALLGIMSYFFLPIHVFQSQSLRLALMIVSVVSMGFVLCLVSWIMTRKRLNESFWSTEKFIHGVVFGMAYSLTRAWAVG
ncbi:MAG: hypothetical protein ACKVQW_04345 [Pyrinomonadaceae bacterium]